MRYLFILLFSIFLSCDGQSQGKKSNQEKSGMREKIDSELAVKFEKDSDFLYQLPNGNEIYMMENPKGNNVGLQYEREPAPSFFTVYKEFYPDGFIKKKETRFGQYTNVGISEYYDEKGNVEKKNEEEKFGKIKPSDVLKILDKKKLINISTGEGRLSENGTEAFTVKYDESKHEYTVTMQNGKPNKNPEFGIGEPPAFLPVTYIINGETGEVKEQ
ncbi:hypothetical protein SAMN05443633_101132 [Chryseobacterium arachidis]|uniref:MORN repeat variant n=2 Tax=Chryseobacterium arachidis TaxID=1416778 RepID=A0A1M4T1T0_9FLAO|nr:hypothetical protein SAMN05443633_101132 [Chryseobacterium arachidis]